MTIERRSLSAAASVRLASVLGLGFVGACVVAPSDDAAVGSISQPVCSVVIDDTRSLLVTDATALGFFPLQRVLDQLLARAGTNVPQTSLGLYQQWFDTLNDAAHAQTKGPHCTGTINGFSSECPRQEGLLAATNPFPPAAPGAFDDTYRPTALVFRIDLAPSNGSTCGEARIVYGKENGNGAGRNFLIFEGTIQNPTPSAGLAGCLPIAQFWADQSNVADAATRAKNLEAFYFSGVPAQGNRPIVDPANYGMSGGGGYGVGGSGQIRTNMFMPGRTYLSGAPLGQPWQLREFKTARVCTQRFGGPAPTPPPTPIDPVPVVASVASSGDDPVRFVPLPLPLPLPAQCRLEIHDVTTKNNPSKSLFADLPANAAFQRDFLPQIASLASQDLATIGMNIPDTYDTGESTSGDNSNDYVNGFNSTGAFAGQVAARLAAIGRTDLTPANIVERATTQSCGGCHQVSNFRDLGGTPSLQWPPSNGFTMIDEQSRVAQALAQVFLPHRHAVLAGFLGGACASGGNVAPPATPTLGGNALN